MCGVKLVIIRLNRSFKKYKDEWSGVMVDTEGKGISIPSTLDEL